MTRAPRRNVLVVQHDPELRATLGELLEDAGFRVTTAPTGRQALTLLSGVEPPSLILLDLHVPGLNGYDLLRHLAADPKLNPIPVVALSGLEHMPPPGVRALLSASFSAEELLRVVRAHHPGL